MKVLGVTGGVGSGKSEVLDWLRDAYGARICQMDETAKRLQRKGTECFRQIVEAFGTDILREDGELDRVRLGNLIFSDADRRNLLNGIVHPAVVQEVRREIAEAEAEGCSLFVVEAALLPRAGKEVCHQIWYIYVREEIRRQRLKASRGYSDKKITSMILSQPSEEEFRRASAAVIDNSGSFEDTKKQIGDLLDNENVQHSQRQQR